MDLLSMFSGLFTQSSSVDALSEKSGTDSTQTKGILETALPMLFSALTSNASSESGASSLLGALQQHTNTDSIENQIKDADAEDGSKIIAHILGSKQSDVVQAISEKTGATANQVSSLLSNMAPSMMSGLSAVASATKKTAASAKKAADEQTATLKEAAKKINAASLLGAVKKVDDNDKKEEAAKEDTAEKAEAAEAKTAEPAGLDLSSILGLFGGATGSQSGSSGGLGDILGGLSSLGGLFGGGSDDGAKSGSEEGGSLLGNLFKSFLG